MLRNPILLIALTLGFALPAPRASALGLGDMRTQSALNQPFYAEIDLFDVKGDELDAVKVRLAGREDFDKSGAERPHYLTRLQFVPVLGPGGRPVVEVTSREPMREPYLDFLVEVLWPKGRLVKEFTVLLDPPVSGSHRAPTQTQPRAVAPVRRAPPRPAPRRAPEPPASPPRSEPRSEPRPPVPAPATPVATTAPEPVVPAQAAATSFPLHYGPVASGAGLARVARKMAPPGATLPQTAMAIYRNNQDAFVRGNINLLKVGAELSIPSAEALFALDPASAEAQFQDAMAGRSVVSKPIADSQPQLKIAAAPDAGAEDDGAPAEAAPGLEDDLLLVREASESNRQETTELRGRIHELEQQLGDIRRLLELRNEQLAQLQLALKDPDEVKTAASALPAPASERTDAAPMGASAEGMEHGADVAPLAPIIEPGLGQIGRISDSAPAEPLPVPPAPGMADAEPDAEPVRPAPQPAPAADKAADAVKGPVAATSTARTEPEQRGFVQTVMSSVPLWALVAGVGAVGLGSLGLIAYRRRRRAVSDAADEDIHEMSSEAMEAAAADETAQAESDTRLTGSPSKPTEPQEAGVLAEADIYLLYGRYREAEAILLDERQNDPDRVDLLYKLADVYIASGDREALEDLVGQMREAGQNRADLDKWANITRALGDMLVQDGQNSARDESDPDANSRPGGAPVPTTGAASPTAPEPEPQDLDLDLPDLDAMEETLPGSGSPGRKPKIETIRAESGPTAGAPAAPAPADDELDLDLDDLNRLTELYQSLHPSALAAHASDAGSAQKPLPQAESAGKREAVEVEWPKPPSFPEEPEMPSGLDEPGPKASDRAPEAPVLLSEPVPIRPDLSKTESGDRGEAGNDGEWDDVLSDDPAEEHWRLDSGLWDETATKMDLARAYIEMQDPDAARAILEDVVQDGNEAQRAEAQSLLAKCG